MVLRRAAVALATHAGAAPVCSAGQRCLSTAAASGSAAASCCSLPPPSWLATPVTHLSGPVFVPALGRHGGQQHGTQSVESHEAAEQAGCSSKSQSGSTSQLTARPGGRWQPSAGEHRRHGDSSARQGLLPPLQRCMHTLRSLPGGSTPASRRVFSHAAPDSEASQQQRQQHQRKQQLGAIRWYWFDSLVSRRVLGGQPGMPKEASTSAPHSASAQAAARAVPENGELPREFHQAGPDKVSIKAQVVFDACWRRCEETFGDRLQSPAEIVWLNGAPGSGKGTNTPYILDSRGLSRAVTMSSLLDSSPEIREIKDRGELVPDTLVGDALLTQIFDPDVNDGIGLVIDGFPRTALQVDFLKMLYDRMLALHLKHADTPDEWRFPRPSFKVVVLYVEQEESVRRQMHRAHATSLHNQRALDAGSTEEIQELRSTDMNEAKCRARYAVFKQHYGTLLRLKQYFPFSLIDAMGSLDDCRRQINRELRYQSSMDLEEDTYAAIRHLPLAKDLVRLSRQQLVHRLDSYMAKRHLPAFLEVIRLLDSEVVPLLRKCSLAGHAEYKTQNPLFKENAAAPDMLLDILSDRGFSGSYIVNERIIPAHVNLGTGEIENEVNFIHKFRITFEKLAVREESSTALTPETAIGHTFLPRHLAQLEADRPAVVAAATMEALQQQAAFSKQDTGSNADHLLRKSATEAAKTLDAVADAVHGEGPQEGHPHDTAKPSKDGESYEMPKGAPPQ